MAKKADYETYPEPNPTRQGTAVTLTELATGKADHFVVWDLVVDRQGDAMFSLKRPTPDDTIEYTLQFKADEKRKK